MRSKTYYFVRGVARFITYTAISLFWLGVLYVFYLAVWSLQFAWG